jgi:hypothetical protein
LDLKAHYAERLPGAAVMAPVCVDEVFLARFLECVDELDLARLLDVDAPDLARLLDVGAPDLARQHL